MRDNGWPQVVSAFPATGKTHLATTRPGVFDSDSSRWSWRRPGVRHSEWPQNYMAHIAELRQSSARLILVSSHAEVRNALVQAGVPFALAYPAEGLREEYRERMERRGSPAALIRKVIEELWTPALAACRGQQGCDHIMLGPAMYLSDAVEPDLREDRA